MAVLEGARVVLGVDNDEAGEMFRKKVKEAGIGYIECLPDGEFKDWNEQLIGVKRHSKPIQRLMRHRGRDREGW